MSIQLPTAPGRRAILKGGLAAGIAAALSSCGLGQTPALAGSPTEHDWSLILMLKARLTEARELAQADGKVWTVSAARSVIATWERECAIGMRHTFTNGTVYLGIKIVPDDDGSQSLFIVWQNPKVIEGMVFDQFITREPGPAEQNRPA